MPKVLITGTNRGIGLELCRQFAARGDEVIAVCRSPSADLTNLDLQLISGIDVSSATDVAGLASRLKGQSLDMLINNAGRLTAESLDNLDFDSIQRQFEINTLGPLRVTHALLENLAEGAKVGIVSSRVGSLADDSSGGMYGYRISKTAVNMVGVNLSIDLRKRAIALAILHPGLVATEMTGGSGVTPELAAQGLIARMDQLNLANSGKFWHAEGYELPW